MMDNNPEMIADTENVARILHQNWVIDGILQHYAFVLRRNETYISVNRPAVSSYDDDIASFVESHPDFYANENKTEYMRALLNVGEIRQTEVRVNETRLNIEVEVEPRDVFTKSHAGVFTRHDGRNIKAGEAFSIESLKEDISS